jgi:transcriptional regulator with XRE-family HTH domain
MISNKIEQLRKEKNVKQTDIAQAIGFTVSGYQKAIQANDFKVSTLEKIAEALEVPVTYFFEDSGDKHFLSEIFLPFKDVKSKEFKEAMQTTISLFVLQQYETYFYNDSEVAKLRSKTLKKEYDAFCKKVPNTLVTRACSVFFGVNIYFNYYNDIPVEIRNEVIAMINRINSEFYTEVKENKSIHWLLKNDIIAEKDLLQMVNNIALDYRKRQTDTFGEFVEVEK